ncbi:cation:proton antiporter [Persicimonas caeni]|nr:cation:proton antiporter [Persicimonas caeni]
MEAAAGQFLVGLALLVVAAAVMAFVGRLARMPSIVSYLLAGLAIGPLFGWVAPAVDEQTALQTISKMGIVLLLFLVGVELSLDRIRQVGRVALAAGLGQVVFTAAGGFLLAWALGFEPMPALFIAVALTFSSTVVVVKLLDQKGDLSSLYGRIAVGIFLVQDLVVVVILTLLAGLGSPEAMTPMGLATSLGKAFSGVACLIVVALLSARYLLPRALGWAARSPRVLFMWSLAWCFGFVLAAQLLDLSLEIGAFVAGLAIAQLEVAEDLRRRIHPLMSFFIAVFFVSLGAQTEFGAAADYWVEAVVLSLFVLVGNPFIFMWIIARYGYSERTSFFTSVTVAQISEFSFIFAALGLSLGVIDAGVLSLITLVGIVTISLSAYMILYNRPLYDLLRSTGILRVFGASHNVDEEPDEDGVRGHIVVVGMNDLGRRLCRQLHEMGEQVVAVDTDAGKLEGLPCEAVIGDVDFPSTLESARMGAAKLAVSALRIETVNKLFAYRMHQMGIPCVIYGMDHWTLAHLCEAGAAQVLDGKELAARGLVAALEQTAEVRP